jgi:hypothetical protein
MCRGETGSIVLAVSYVGLVENFLGVGGGELDFEEMAILR